MQLKKFVYKSELKNQRKLFNECFPENIGTSVEKESHYLWKFHSKKVSPQSLEYGAFLDNELIGYYAAIPYHYSYKNEHWKAGMVCDVMTGIKARGKGVFTKMGVFATDDMKVQGIDFTTGYPIRPEVIPGHLKAGWEKVFPLPLYMCFISSKSLLAKKKLNILYPLFDYGLKIYQKIAALFLSKKKYEIQFFSSSKIENIVGLEDFFLLWQKEHAITLTKDIDFLKWRLGAPEKEYQIFVAREKNQIIGFSIVRCVEKEGVPSVAILDFSTLKEFRTVNYQLFQEIKNFTKKIKAEVLLMMTNNSVRNCYSLYQNGFLKSPYTFWLIIKKFNNNIPFDLLRNESNWHLTWIDSDDL